MRNKIVIAIVAFIVGLTVYDVFIVDLYVATKVPEPVEYVTCPNEQNFNEVWNHWSYGYLVANPGVGIDTQMNDWNVLMVQNGCDEEWLNPLDDLIDHYITTTSSYTQQY